MGKKGACLFIAGWEWDGKVGSNSADGVGWDYTISRRDDTGRDRGTGHERSGNGLETSQGNRSEM